MNKICLIIPCYNEENRINLQTYKQKINITFIFINDGSNDNTYQKIQASFLGTAHHVLNLEKNVGKAEATRQGMIFAQSLDNFAEFEWLGFWDADLAIPLYEADNFVLYHDMFYPNFDAVFGSRIKRLGSSTEKKIIRSILGKIFVSMIRVLFKTNIYDSQCGAKLFKASLANKIFAEPFISKWLFDIEILMRLKLGNFKTVEYPLKEASEILNNSNVKILNEMTKVCLDVIKIWQKYRNLPTKKI